MGKPVVASRLPMVVSTFPPGTVATYDSGDEAAMARAIAAFADDPIAREAAVVRTAAVVRAEAWEEASKVYVAIVDGLIEGRSAPTRRTPDVPAEP